MKRRLVSFVLALALVCGLSVTAGAYTDKQLRAADALNHLDLFRGRSSVGKDYDLDGTLNRAEGTILLLRIIGKETEANQTDVGENPFTDVTVENLLGWAIQGLTYAYKMGLVKGTSATTFAPKEDMSDYMFLTLLLRQLGYKDNTMVAEGEAYDFIWNSPYGQAKELGIVDSLEADSDGFTRGGAALLSWKAMEATFKGSDETLAERLIDEGVFTAAEYADAKEIWTYGSIQSGTTTGGSSGTTTPTTPTTPSTPSTPSTPTTPDSGEEESGAVVAPSEMTYDVYSEFSPEEQQAYMETHFGTDYLAYMQWLSKIQDEYEASREVIEGDGSIDIGDYIESQS